MNLSILIPYRPGNRERERLLDCVLTRAYQLRESSGFNTVEVLTADDDHASEAIFNHGQAINNAARLASGDIFLVMDADTTYEEPTAGDTIGHALRESQEHRTWYLPECYYQLEQRLTDDALAGGWIIPTELRGPDGVSWSGRSWAGLVIIPREAFELVRGYDERYEGHGADDMAFGVSLDTLYGQHLRYDGAAVHLYHTRGAEENAAHNPELTRRYEAAAGNQEAMWEIIEEKPRWP